MKKIWLIGNRIYYDEEQQTFVIAEAHGKYQIYPDELSQMFMVAFKMGLVDLRIFANDKSDDNWGGKFNLRLNDEKQFKTWFEESEK